MKKHRKIIFFSTVVLMASTATAFSFNVEESKAAYIELSGTISSSGPSSAFSSSGITPEQVRELNDMAETEGYDAIIYEINSGGGTVVASKEIMREIESSELETVCRFRDVAASGAYLLSLGCDEIVADSATITGSIGVKSSYLEFSEALEKYGVEYVNVSSGEFKGVGDPYKNSTEEDKEILREQASEIHDEFLQIVQDERNLTDQRINDVGDGKVILGDDAREKGLVDANGGRKVAEQRAENLTDTELDFEELETTESFNFFSLLSASLPNIFTSEEVPLTAEL